MYVSTKRKIKLSEFKHGYNCTYIFSIVFYFIAEQLNPGLDTGKTEISRRMEDACSLTDFIEISMGYTHAINTNLIKWRVMGCTRLWCIMLHIKLILKQCQKKMHYTLSLYFFIQDLSTTQQLYKLVFTKTHHGICAEWLFLPDQLLLFSLMTHRIIPQSPILDLSRCPCSFVLFLGLQNKDSNLEPKYI